MKLYIGNKNYSSWSLRAWLVLKQAGIAFEEIEITLNPEAGSTFKSKLAAAAPQHPGKVPLLVADDGFAVWDSLAIVEFIAEKYPDKNLWPADFRQRARARSLCAEMHSGFVALRSNLVMNTNSSFPEVGARVMSELPEVAADVARIDEIWRSQLADSKGPFLFGEFGIADAFYAPVCLRFRTYATPLSPAAASYCDRVLSLPGMQAWTWDAMADRDFIATYEPYRDAR